MSSPYQANTRQVKSNTFAALLQQNFSIQEQILSNDRFQDAPVLTSRTKTYKEMCEVLSQQLQIVLESAVAPPENSIYSEVEMKNMSRVMQQAFEAALKGNTQTKQVSRTLHNQDPIHLTAITTIPLDEQHIQRVMDKVLKCRTMRDFTLILETELLPTLKEQDETFVEISRSARQVFETMKDQQQSMDVMKETSEQRCRDIEDANEHRIKTLEEDIASMIRQMKEQDKRTQKFKD